MDIYVVKSGDTLYAIARRYAVPPEDIAYANQLQNPALLSVGQALVIPTGKILLGVPNYGYDWTLPFTQGTAARPLTNVGAVRLAGQVRAAIQYDETAQAPFFRYYDESGRQHEVWFEDARSLRAKYELVGEYGLAGVSFWNLDNLFRTNFLVLESLYSVEKPF